MAGETEIVVNMNDPAARAKMRIFCADCEKRVQIVWQATNPDSPFYNFVHVRCHGVDRLVTFSVQFTRRAHFMHLETVDILWSELHDYGNLQQLLEQQEAKAQEHMEIARVIERVLKQQDPPADEVPA